jgi:POT family proton-dependent oligopeptide transporter
MEKRTPFPGVFWVANLIEVLERFAYYGIYMGFGIYMNYLGYTRDQLGIIQGIFLFVSYVVPLFSGTFADRYGFKKVLIVSYVAYLPSILLLMLTKSFSGIALTMLSIGLAAGIFKPLISGTVRTVTDGSNKTLGFGLFYMMVNVGASFGPLIAGKLRVISWNYAFLAAAIGICLMLVITIIFYKEPERKMEGESLHKKFKDMGEALSDIKFAVFLVLLGIFFWIPFWSFFNVLPLYIETVLDTTRLYRAMDNILWDPIMNLISRTDENGIKKILGETISHTGWLIIFFQLFVTRISEKFKTLPSFMTGIFIAAIGFFFIGFAKIASPSWVFLGIFLFAIGEMTSSPRIQEYITWIAPKEKAGLYMGCNFLATGLGGSLSGVYTWLFGYFQNLNNPEYIWYVFSAHALLGIVFIYLFTRFVGEFEELKE